MRIPVGRVVFVTITAALASCAAPPDRDIALARSKVAAAREAGAEQAAPAAARAMAAAEVALDAELAAQRSRWWKSYDLADDLAIAVQAAADFAADAVVANRERALVAARQPGAEALFGPNLFENPSFASGTAAWGLNPGADATVSIVAVEGGQSAWHVNYRKGNWSVIYQEQVLKPDTVYVYEAWVKTTAPVVSLYWQSDIGRFFETDKTYPTWTHARSVFVTPHWKGQPYRVGFCPLLMQGAGEAWLRDLRISEVRPR